MDPIKQLDTTGMHRPARDEKSQLTNRSPHPFWDKLMVVHGFTKAENSFPRLYCSMHCGRS
jgi:hypothetical protein